MNKPPIYLCVFVCALATVAEAGRLKEKQNARELTLRQRVAHLFDRLAFGARPGEAERMSLLGEKGIDKWIGEQMKPDQIKDASLEATLKTLPSYGMSVQALNEHYPSAQQFAKNVMGISTDDFKKNNDDVRKKVREKIGVEHLPERIVDDLVAQKVIRAVESRKQLQEVLVDFWFNHFNVNIDKNEEKKLMGSYERDAIRPHLFGKFRDLLSATAHHPAMLDYLDNRLSEGGERSRKGLNENYAREILELHTLGVDGGYTQKDVTELARILTGWGIEDMPANPTFKFKERAHDKKEKEFLGQKFAAGGGQEEGERVLDILATHPSTAHFIALKLCRTFVADVPPSALVAKVAEVFLKSGGDLSQTYLSIFKSPEFWAKAAYRNKIKTPFQYVVSAIRATGGEVAVHSQIRNLLSQMGQPPYKCVPPTGYKDVSDAWVNPGALVDRLNFSMRLAGNRIEGVYIQLPVVNPKNATEKLVDEISSKLLHENLSPESQKVVLSEFNKETRTMADGEVRPLSLAKATGLILGSPEFQRR